MNNAQKIIAIMAAAASVASAAHADSWVVINPDGSTTETRVSGTGQTQSVRTRPAAQAPTRQTSAGQVYGGQGYGGGVTIGQEATSAIMDARQAAYNGVNQSALNYDSTRRYDNGYNRHNGNTVQQGTTTYTGRSVYTYPYPVAGGFYTYPTYPYSYQLPTPLGGGPVITNIPSPGIGYYSYPAYPVYNAPGAGYYPYYGYPANNCPPYGYNGYIPPVTNYVSPYGNGYYNYNSSISSTYGGLTIGGGGASITLGGGRIIGSGSRVVR